jgi:hypothetical protein
MRGLHPLLLLGSLAACGARTELRVTTPDASAVPDAVTVDAVTADAAQLADVARPVDVGAPIDTPSPTACIWTAAAPLAITAGDRDRSPLAVRVLDDRLWVGFQSSNPDRPGNQGRFVRVTDELGRPVAPAVDVLPSPNGSSSLASSSGKRRPLRGCGRPFGPATAKVGAWNWASRLRGTLCRRIERWGAR